MEIIGYIYIISNNQNNKVYIGQTLYTNLQERFKEHIRDSKREQYASRSLYQAFNAIGIESFSISLLESVPLELLDKKERQWINYYDFYYQGYNDTLGGVSRQRFDYEPIMSDFLDGMPIKDICAKYQCSDAVIHNALVASGCEHRELNGAQIFSHCLVVKNKQSGTVIRTFPFLKEAAEWVKSIPEYSNTSLHSIKTTIGEAANPNNATKSAYGYTWEYDDYDSKINKNKDAGIYGVKDLLSGEILYVGHTTKSFSIRWKQHLRKYQKLQWPLYNYIRQNDVDSIEFVVLEVLDSSLNQDIFLERERYWISHYHTDKNGLNKRRPAKTIKSHSFASQIEEIFELLLSGAENQAISQKFDITSSTLSLIRIGKIYYNPQVSYPIVSNNRRSEIELVKNTLELLSLGKYSLEFLSKNLNISKKRIKNIAEGNISHALSIYMTDIIEQYDFPISIFSNDAHTSTKIKQKIYNSNKKQTTKEAYCSVCGQLLTDRQQKYCSNECQHKAQKRPRPSRAELKGLIRSSSFTAIGRKYDVTDNAIRKWCKEYGLPSTTWEIQQYSNDEWECEEWNNNCNDTVPEQRNILYDSIVRELLSCRNGKIVEEHQKISKGTMSTARHHYNLPYLPAIQYCSTSCYCEETQLYFMSAKDAATWLVENQYGKSVDALRSKIASAFRADTPTAFTLSDSSTGASSTFTFSPVPQDTFYSVIQHHHVISYAFDPKWRALIEEPSILPDFVSLDDLPWVDEFKKFYGME